MIRIFIGYDQDEVVAYHVLADSIIKHASEPVSITPVTHRHLHREREAGQSTDFAYARFLVPWMCGYQGFAIWMDADMLCRTDIAQLWALRDGKYAVQVVPKDFWPEDGIKFLGRQQRAYPVLPDGTNRKLWSAMMIMNCARCGALTRGYVETAPGLELHQFAWLEDAEIGYLLQSWQHVAAVDAYDSEAKLVHWTLGGPWFADTDGGGYAKEWFHAKSVAVGSTSC